MLVAAVCENVAKMLFAAGRYDDINASSYGIWYEGGPGYIPAGTNRDGIRTAMGIYDIHGSGLGATPLRDGVNTGGHMNIPSGGISDVERIEMQYPFLYFSRNHNMPPTPFSGMSPGATESTFPLNSLCPRALSSTVITQQHAVSHHGLEAC